MRSGSTRRAAVTPRQAESSIAKLVHAAAHSRCCSDINRGGARGMPDRGKLAKNLFVRADSAEPIGDAREGG